MKHIHRIDLGQWPQLMVITNDKRAYGRFMRDKQGPDIKPFPSRNGGHCLMMTQESSGACIFMIAIGSHDDQIELASTLAHEATHAMRWLFEHIGEHSPGTETQAYLVGHIVRCGLQALAA